MPIVGFGSDPYKWNCDEDSDLDGDLPGISLFGNAVQVWAIAQNGDVMVTEAARAFQCDPALVRRAIEAHPFMYAADGDWIGHDGE